VKVLDLGLARLREEGGGQLTAEGAVLGTLDFLAPEQAADARSVDERADLYGLGCTFYFLLTGRVPFLGEESMEKMLKHHLDEPDPVEDLRPGIPARVAAVVRRLMAKHPGDRFQTPAELAEALGPFAGPE